MQIISRTVSILEEVARRPDGGGLVEIANATSLPAATCHRLLAALAEDELVQRDPLTRRYSVGPGLVQLSGMVTQIGRGASIEAGMTALRDRWRECFFLASVVDDAIICVRSMPTIDANRMTVTVPLGQPMAPNVAGSAKAILAHVSPAERERLIAAGGGMTRLTIYIDTGNTATTLVAGIYTDSSGKPGTLLAQGTLTGVTSGAWNTVTVPSATLTSGATYWIAILAPTGTVRFRDRAGIGGATQPCETSAQTTLTTLPATWTTGVRYNDGPLAAYGTT
jgi:DNA-binding IclR family transcriptional regulator